MANNIEKGCYYDKNSDSYYIKYKGITRRGFTKEEAIKYRQGLKLGFITLEDIDNETKRNRKSNSR